MSGMFYNNKNLKRIYASNKFVTTSVQDEKDNDMFKLSTNLIGGAGTNMMLIMLIKSMLV